jgi:hypothetical protein
VKLLWVPPFSWPRTVPLVFFLLWNGRWCRSSAMTCGSRLRCSGSVRHRERSSRASSSRGRAGSRARAALRACSRQGACLVRAQAEDREVCQRLASSSSETTRGAGRPGL